MLNTLLGTKKGMVPAYDSRGRRVGATVIELGPNYITRVKTEESKDGYSSIQIGYSEKKNLNKPQTGHLKKAGIEKNLRFIKEVRVKSQEELENLQPGKEIKVGDIFSSGDSVKVTATSKGKGFQGGVKKYGFAGGPKTHGQSDRHRAPGSSGSGTTPGRVYKGKKMAGRMGGETISYLGVEVISIDRKNNLITVKGGVPGPVGGLVKIEKQGRIKGYIAPPEEKIDEEEEAKEAENRDVEADSAMEAQATPEAGEVEEPSVISNQSSPIKSGSSDEVQKVEEVKEGENNG